jgi:acyl-CoA reductase-like NAD-dependent aldehyde dehydrogenase
VFAANGEDDAVALANGVPYGLAASVWTTDVTARCGSAGGPRLRV